jgi:hypothetical protein
LRAAVFFFAITGLGACAVGPYEVVEDAFARKLEYGVSPGYALQCNARFHGTPSFGRVWRDGVKGQGYWSYDLYESLSVAERETLEPEGIESDKLGAFSHSEAHRLCLKHEAEYPDHKCRIQRIYPDFHGDNMG